MAGNSSASFLGLFRVILADFGAGCTADVAASGGSTSFFWVSDEAFDALEMGSKFINMVHVQCRDFLQT